MLCAVMLVVGVQAVRNEDAACLMNLHTCTTHTESARAQHRVQLHLQPSRQQICTCWRGAAPRHPAETPECVWGGGCTRAATTGRVRCHDETPTGRVVCGGQPALTNTHRGGHSVGARTQPKQGRWHAGTSGSGAHTWCRVANRQQERKTRRGGGMHTHELNGGSKASERGMRRSRRRQNKLLLRQDKTRRV